MEAFLGYFEHLPTWIKATWILFFLAFFWITEGYYSFYKNPNSKWKHAKTNIQLLLLVVIINSFFGVLLIFIDERLSESSFGLLNYLDVPLWIKLLISIVILDFTSQYFVHFLLHKVRWMWRLHIVRLFNTRNLCFDGSGPNGNAGFFLLFIQNDHHPFYLF